MQPKPFKEQNKLLGSGNNPNTNAMPICVSANLEMSNGHPIPFLFSFWSMSAEEIEAAKQSGGIYIGVMGTGQPPIIAYPENPFKNHGYTPLEIGKYN